MTKKQKLFCEEYMIDLNGTQAAIRAGYSPDTAYSIASELLKNPEVRARIDAEMATRSRRTGINADRVIRELARVAFVNAPDVLDVTNATVKAGATADDTAVIASVKVKRKSGADFEEVEREIRLADKLKALEILSKHLGMLTDKVEHSGSVEVKNDKLAAILEQLTGK